jgi:dihydroxy-acid dehydratase
VVARRIDVDLPDEVIAARIAAYVPPERDIPSGVLAKYAAHVSSASQGAITSP